MKLSQHGPSRHGCLAISGGTCFTGRFTHLLHVLQCLRGDVEVDGLRGGFLGVRVLDQKLHLFLLSTRPTRQQVTTAMLNDSLTVVRRISENPKALDVGKTRTSAVKTQHNSGQGPHFCAELYLEVFVQQGPLHLNADRVLQTEEHKVSRNLLEEAEIRKQTCA